MTDYAKKVSPKATILICGLRWLMGKLSRLK
jgi:hypothetical protein